MREPLTNEQLEKFNSTEGIIEILCDIPNFTMDMYEQLEEDKKALVDYTISINLVTNSQIDRNLRRSMNDNNLALLNQRKLTALSLYYFGKKDDNNKYIEYICPYTGKHYNLDELNYELTKPYKQRNKDKILELEHILAHSSKGGTVLFNCIPSSKEANSKSEKSDLHLLDWFKQSGNKFYDKDRLYNLVNYILSAYSISFKEFKESEIDYLYEYTQNEELETDNEELANEKLIQQKIKNKKNMTIDGYIPFLNQLINELNKSGYNITPFITKLKELENNNIFKDIDKYTIVQDTIEKLFKEYNTEENTSYLTYSINIDYIKLVNSINSNNKEEIETILKQRLSTIKYLIDTNNKTMKDYFISLRDIESIDILYINNPNEQDIQSFVDNIKLSFDTKIEIIIKMIENAKTPEEVANIIKQGSTEKFKTYKKDENGNIVVDKEYGEIKHFWVSNSLKIKRLICSNDKYLIARQNLDNYYMMTLSGQCSEEGNRRRQEMFIKMIENAQTPEEVADIVKAGTTEKFKTYKKNEDGNIIVDKEYGEIGNFWSNGSNRKKITEMIYSDDKYLIARQNLDNYYMMTLSGQLSKEGQERRQEILIKMIENAKSAEDVANIVKQDTTERFKTYKKDENGNIVVDKEYGKIRVFWSSNSTKIKEIIESDDKYLIARQNLDNYYMMTLSGQLSKEGQERRQEIFIKMIENAQTPEEVANIAKYDTTEKFKTYIKDEKGNIIVDKEYGEILDYWSSNRKKIQEMIYMDDKYLIARQNLDNYYIMTKSGQLSEEGKIRRVEIFIKMLENAKTTEEVADIVKAGTTEKFKTYKKDEKGNIVIDKEYGEIGNFWSNGSNRKKITEIINTDERYLLARQNLDNYYMMTKSGQCSVEGQERRQEMFIKMIENAQTPEEVANIVNNRSTEKFKTYKKDEKGNIVIDKEYGEIGSFWSNGSNRKKITEIINTDERYLLARQNLDNYYMMTLSGQKSEEGQQRRQEIFIKMLENAEKSVEVAVIVKQGTTEKFKTYKKDKDGNIVIDKEYGPLARFWNTNSQKYIIPLLFYNKSYDDKQKKYVDSDKDYSGHNYDNARRNILKYLKVDNINDYINKLDEKDKKTKKVQDLIDLRNSLREKDERLIQYENHLIEENNQLREELNKSTRRVV